MDSHQVFVFDIMLPRKNINVQNRKNVFQRTVSKGWTLEGRGSLNWRHIIVIGAYKTFDLHVVRREKSTNKRSRRRGRTQKSDPSSSIEIVSIIIFF